MLQGGGHTHGAKDGIFQCRNPCRLLLQEEDGAGVFGKGTAAGIAKQRFGGKERNVGQSVAVDEGKQIPDGSCAKIIDWKGNRSKHGGNAVSFRRIITAGQGDVPGDMVP